MTRHEEDGAALMDRAIGNFGDPVLARIALTLVVRTARDEMPMADANRRDNDWPCLSRWVHRTRGALVLFGAAELLAMGEHFEQLGADPARQMHAGEAFDGYRAALEGWLVMAARVLEQT